MPNQNALINLLLSNNLVNTVIYPMRVTLSSSSLIDVMITNKNFNHLETKMFTPINDVGQVNQISWNIKTMFVTPITEKEILGVTVKLKSKYSTGSDGIPALLIKHCVQHKSTNLYI
jgi:hypothetical protein